MECPDGRCSLTHPTVRYIKMFPGIPGSESMLVATADGILNKIFIDSPFPIQIQKIITGTVYNTR